MLHQSSSKLNLKGEDQLSQFQQDSFMREDSSDLFDRARGQRDDDLRSVDSFHVSEKSFNQKKSIDKRELYI